MNDSKNHFGVLVGRDGWEMGAPQQIFSRSLQLVQKRFPHEEWERGLIVFMQ